MAKFGRISFDFQGLSDFDPGDGTVGSVGSVPGLIFSNQVGVATEVSTERKVLVLRGEDSGGYARSIEIDRDFEPGRPVRLLLGLRRGPAPATAFSVNGASFALNEPNGSNERLLVQIKRKSAGSWSTIHSKRTSVSANGFDVEKFEFSTIENSESGGEPYRIRIVQEDTTSIGGSDFDHYVISEISFETAIFSGYLTNPVKTMIRSDDNLGNAYPTNLRVGDRDFRGNSSNFSLFDDTKSIDFTSPFPEAEIEIKGNGEALDNMWLGLTSSKGDYNRNFEFYLAPSGSITSENSRYPNSSFVYLSKLVSIDPPAGPQTFAFNNQVPVTFDPVDAALSLANSINRLSSLLQLKARVKENKVFLKGLTPAIGSFEQGNLIQSGTESGRPIPFSTTQFKITDSGKKSFPALLNKNLAYANQGIDSPNILPDIETYTETLPGISDKRIFFTGSESIQPFSDSLIAMDDTDFYRSGTNPSIIDGFRSPLGSKTQIVFNLKSSDGLGSHIFYATGSAKGDLHPQVAGKNGTGFAYWNDTLKTWEMLPYTHDPKHKSFAQRRHAIRGFTGLTFQENPVYFRVKEHNSPADVHEKFERIKAGGHPTNSSGFPFAAQYNATGSQCVAMSNYISQPFLIEKIRVDFKGNLGIQDFDNSAGTKERISIRDFFILNQTTDGDNSHVTGSHIVDAGATLLTHAPGIFPAKEAEFPYNGIREVITYSRIGLLQKNNHHRRISTSEKFAEFKNSFEKLIEFSVDENNQSGLSGSFSFDCYPKLGLTGENLCYFHNTFLPDEYDAGTGAEYTIDGNQMGGAGLLGKPSGRQIALSMDVADPSTTLTGSTVVSAASYSFIPKSEYSKISPYVILPEDNLVFGWENIPEPVAANCDQINADRVVDRLTDLKITFFGSLISNDREYHDTLNQPLTTVSIHENLFGAPVVDQWDVEPILMLSGSQRDALFSGDMLATGSQGQRGRRASIAEGSAGISGSLNRNLQFLDKNVIYADSQVPPIRKVLETLAPEVTGSADVNIPNVSGLLNVITLTNRANTPSFKFLMEPDILSKTTIQHSLSPEPNLFPFLADPMETSLAASNNLDFPFFAVETVPPAAPDPTDAPFTPYMFGGGQLALNGINSTVTSPEMEIAPVREIVNIQSLATTPPVITEIGPTLQHDFNMNVVQALSETMFSVPNVTFDFGGAYTWPMLPFGLFFLPQCQGFRHGFSNIFPTSPVYHFKKDSFGQLRDLIESPVEGKAVGLIDLAQEDNGDFVADQNAETPPIKVVFVSRGGDSNIDPLDTNSQNLSSFATSSIPYTDGQSRERDVVQFPPPDITDRTTIEEAVEQIIDGDATQ